MVIYCDLVHRGRRCIRGRFANSRGYRYP